MRILSYNLPLDLNTGYSYTHKRIFAALKHREFIYGEYGSNYVGLRKFSDNVYTFGAVNGASSPMKPDLLFIHDDPQRLVFVKKYNDIPKILWLPLDHENPDPPGHLQIISLFNEIIPISKFAYESRNYFTHENIYNPVETNVYKPIGNTKKKFGFKDDDFVMLYVGNTGWRKRFSLTLILLKKVLEKIPNAKLLVATDLTPYIDGFNYHELIYGLGLSKQVFYVNNISKTNPVPPEVLNDMYNACDVYVATHGGEGMGLPIVEAMSAGKPFVATDYTTTAEFSGDGKRGLGVKTGPFFIDKGIKRPFVDLDDFVDKIVWLYENPDERRKMGKRGREWAVKNCDTKIVAAKLDKIFGDYAPVEVKLDEDNLGS